jgi:hypothetical protein
MPAGGRQALGNRASKNTHYIITHWKSRSRATPGDALPARRGKEWR